MVQLKTKSEISVGARAEGGSTLEFNTGSWRALRPNINLDKCVHCMLCFLYCPDNAVKIIKVSDKQGGNPEVIGVDTKHCKGCSICSSVCPVKCITMEKETDALKRDLKE
ncbi:MAG: 4Fe-4S dicluster-binding protein [Candidatus Woesearchaeota archaeon]